MNSLHSFCSGFDGARWRVYAYDASGREMVFFKMYSDSSVADEVARRFASEIYSINWEDWRGSIDSRYWRYM